MVNTHLMDTKVYKKSLIIKRLSSYLLYPDSVQYRKNKRNQKNILY